MNGILYVALGGAIGASGRHLLGLVANASFGSAFPYGTFLANVIGGFLMGVLVGWLAQKVTGAEDIRLLLGVGVLGGFTTFSTFSLDAYMMFEKKAYGSLAAYVSGSVILSVLALMIGLIIGRKLLGT
jgi:CrcB protein